MRPFRTYVFEDFSIKKIIKNYCRTSINEKISTNLITLAFWSVKNVIEKSFFLACCINLFPLTHVVNIKQLSLDVVLNKRSH